MKKLIYTMVTSFFISCALVSQTSLEKANGLMKAGKYSEAIEIYQNFLQKNPKNIGGWLLLTEAYEKSGNLESAENSARKIIEIDDESLDGYAAIGRIQRLRGKYSEASSTLNNGLKLIPKGKPKHYGLLIELGWTYLAMDSVDPAIAMGVESREINPTKPEAYEILGYSYIKLNQGILAVTNFEEALKTDSMRINSLKGLAEAYITSKNYTEAARTYNRILEKEPNNELAITELAKLLFKAKQYSKSVAVLKPYIDSKKDVSQEVKLMYIDALVQSNQYDEAYKEAKEMASVLPDSPTIIRAIANGYYKNEQYSKAIEEFNKLKIKDTLKFDDYRLLGFAYKKIKKDILAASAWDEALKDTTAPDITRSYLAREIGGILMLSKGYEKAIEYYKISLELDPTAIAPMINMAQCYMQLKKYKEAISALKDAISKNPNYPPVYVNLGYAYFSLNDTLASRREFERAISIVGSSTDKYKNDIADSYRMLALIKMGERKTTSAESRKKFEDAVELLKKSLKYKEDVAQTHILLGSCYQNLADFDSAMREYKRALEIEPKNKEAIERIENLKKIQ